LLIDWHATQSPHRDTPGALHHVIIRGIERKAIFKDNSDRDSYLKGLALIISETETVCYAWLLMTTHIHQKKMLGI
jgi:REP element-mobilizing transposase RayT